LSHPWHEAPVETKEVNMATETASVGLPLQNRGLGRLAQGFLIGAAAAALIAALIGGGTGADVFPDRGVNGYSLGKVLQQEIAVIAVKTPAAPAERFGYTQNKMDEQKYADGAKARFGDTANEAALVE